MSINIKTYYQTPNSTNSVTDDDILVVQQMGGSSTPSYDQMKKTTIGAIKTDVLANSALTGTPTAPTAAAGTSTTQVATTAFVMNAVQGSITTAIDGSY